MKTASVCVAALALALANPAEATPGRGGLVEPKPRQVTNVFKRLCYEGLKNAPDQDILLDSLENMDAKKEGKPHSPLFDVHNGCRGMVYEPTRPVTTLRYDSKFTVSWNVEAPAPGFLEINIVKPISDFATPFIRHTPIRNLAYNATFGDKVGPGSVTVSIPQEVTGCEVAGVCSIQFHWRAKDSGATFDSCADIRMQPKRVEFTYVRPLSALNAQNLLLTAKKSGSQDVTSFTRTGVQPVVVEPAPKAWDFAELDDRNAVTINPNKMA